MHTKVPSYLKNTKQLIYSNIMMVWCNENGGRGSSDDIIVAYAAARCAPPDAVALYCAYLSIIISVARANRSRTGVNMSVISTRW